MRERWEKGEVKETCNEDREDETQSNNNRRVVVRQPRTQMLTEPMTTGYRGNQSKEANTESLGDCKTNTNALKKSAEVSSHFCSSTY